MTTSAIASFDHPCLSSIKVDKKATAREESIYMSSIDEDGEVEPVATGVAVDWRGRLH